MEATNLKIHERPSFAILSDEEIFALVRRKMEDEKRFLEPYLTIELLAEELNVHRNSLSRAVNRFAGVSFPLWLASYRIAEVERLVSQSENGRYSIAVLALKAGFSSRTSFYRVYKTIKQAKPSEALPGRKKNQ